MKKHKITGCKIAFKIGSEYDEFQPKLSMKHSFSIFFEDRSPVEYKYTWAGNKTYDHKFEGEEIIVQVQEDCSKFLMSKEIDSFIKKSRFDFLQSLDKEYKEFKFTRKKL